MGAYLLNRARHDGYSVHYWRKGNLEVDFVLEKMGRLLAIEVKSGRRRESLCGLAAWQREFPHGKVLLVGSGGVGLHEFFHSAPMQWCQF